MTDSITLSKVEILISQNKFQDAERFLLDLLSQDPNNVYCLGMLAEVYLQQDNTEKARDILNHAIGLSPDYAYLFNIKSRVCIQEDHWDEAENCLNHAIELSPDQAENFALLAQVKLLRKNYEEALNLANEALEIDPENLLGLNTRSTALQKLNRSQESFETIEGALREDPNNSYTHANYGWGLLEKGDHQKALEHFKESLSTDPNSEYAQAGLLEAIKAGNPFYRLFLRYAFFMGNLREKYQWGFIIGFYFGFRALKALARVSSSLQPVLIPLLVVLAIFAFSTWVITPISNLFLRFNKYGQLLLDKKERMSSNFVAGSFAVMLIGLLLYLVLLDERMLSIAAFGFAMMLPFGAMFSPSKNKYGLLIYTLALAGVGCISIGITFWSGELFNLATVVFMFGFIAFQWVANYMLIKENNY